MALGKPTATPEVPAAAEAASSTTANVMRTADNVQNAAKNVLKNSQLNSPESASSAVAPESTLEISNPSPAPKIYTQSSQAPTANPLELVRRFLQKISSTAPEVLGKDSLVSGATVGGSVSTIPFALAAGSYAATHAGALGALGAGAGVLSLPYLGYALGKRIGMPVAGANLGTGAAAAAVVGMSAPGLATVGSMAGLAALPAAAGYVGHHLGKFIAPNQKYAPHLGAAFGTGAGAVGVWAGLNALTPVALSSAAMGGSVAALAGIPALAGYAGYALGDLVGHKKIGAVAGAAAGTIGSMIGVANGSIASMIGVTNAASIPLSLAGAGAVINAPLAAGIVGGAAVLGGGMYALGRMHELAWGVKYENTLKSIGLSLSSPLGLPLRGLEGLHNWAWGRSKEDIAKTPIGKRLARGVFSVATTPLGLVWNKIPNTTKNALGAIYKKTPVHKLFDGIFDTAMSPINLVQDRDPKTIPGAILSGTARFPRWLFTRSDSPHAAKMPPRIQKSTPKVPDELALSA